MMDIQKLPPILKENTDWETRRKELIDVLLDREYGRMPRLHDAISFAEGGVDTSFCAGKATHTRVEATATFGDKTYTFPFGMTVPKTEGPHPFFVYVAFTDAVADKYLPVEEIVDRGFAVLHVCYDDVTPDDRPAPEAKGYYTSSLFRVLYGEEIPADRCGTITVWAWAASRVMDYAMGRDDLDMTRAAVVGHSRLGKTALLAGAQDTRFTHVISNDSGCCGAAITRGKVGEQIGDITRVFPHWFRLDFAGYAGREEEMPFDQHYLLASIAPRQLCVGSALLDEWADPQSELLACRVASAAYEALGLPGLIAPDRPAVAGDVFADGRIAYHLRPGSHYMSRDDWNRYMDVLGK
ncbi:MAG: hypothetical protein J6D21_07710 [Clostridia bacterium]|nr:hypothetical protein [Clostridia bacterium]